MSLTSRVLWTEGLFLLPQHFQQHDRWLEHFVEARGAPLRNHPWGFVELNIDRDLLRLGQLALRSAKGVFPDGTPFDFPDSDDAPLALEIARDVRDQILYLCIPARRQGEAEISRGDDAAVLARYEAAEIDVRDGNSDNMTSTAVEIGKPRFKFVRAGEPRDGYLSLGVVRVTEVRADRSVVLDESFIPPVLDCQASEYLRAFMTELRGMLAQRGQAIAARVGAAGQGGIADMLDALMLIAINRFEPLIGHLSAIAGVHAEEFYRLALQFAGEVSTLTTSERRPKVLPPYQHDDLRLSFIPLAVELRRALTGIEVRAVPIRLRAHKRAGFYGGVIPDKSLISGADFILGVASALSLDEMRNQVLSLVKVGPTEQIQKIWRDALPGVRLSALAVPPHEIPFNMGYAYFILDSKSEYWRDVRVDSSIWVYAGDEFPGVKLEMWAIPR